MTRPRIVLAGYMVVMMGCVHEREGDGRDDAFIGAGKADTGGVGDGSREAAGVLRVANEISVETLRAAPPDGVGLISEAANNISYFRLGDDGVPGTFDDGVFRSLAELDAIPFVGPIAFHQLLAYAETNGFVPDESFEENGLFWVPELGPIAAAPSADGPYFEIVAPVEVEQDGKPVTLRWRLGTDIQAIGSFSCGALDAQILVEAFADESTVTLSTSKEFGGPVNPRCSCVITVTRADPEPGGVVEGTFDGLLAEEEFDTTPPVNRARGAFHVLRDE